MHSLEIIQAINSPDHEELTAEQVAENKARAWIRKGVERALEKARFQIKESHTLAVQRGDLSEDQDLDTEVDLRVLAAPETRDALVASAWHRRNQS